MKISELFKDFAHALEIDKPTIDEAVQLPGGRAPRSKPTWRVASGRRCQAPTRAIRAWRRSTTSTSSPW